MQEKKWTSCRMTVNGLPQEVRYNEATVEGLFVPFLKKLAELHMDAQRRIMAFLAAPPAIGKTTLAQFLEHLSKEREDLPDICAIGIDGFHYPADYLETHTVEREGNQVSMASVKGAPETFDVDRLLAKIRTARHHSTDWPGYDRQKHDIVPAARPVDSQIFLLEGNWILLNDPRWLHIRIFADYSVFLQARPELLKDRLIARKVQGGMPKEDAEAFYNASDHPNIERVLQESSQADEVWEMQADGDFIRIR